MGGINYVQAEEITQSTPIINSDHAAVHKGYAKCAALYLASLAPSAVYTYRFKAPTTLFAHIKNIQLAQIGSSVKLELIRGGVVANPGVEVTNAIHNINDNSVRGTESKIYNSTVTYTGGEVWCSVVSHGSTTNQSVSGASFSQSDNVEYVTKSNGTEYFLKLTNLDNADTSKHLMMNMFFYEEPQGYVE